MSIDSPETYEKLWLSDFFHKFPHIDFTFQEVNSTFDPESGTYKQAVSFWALVPVAVCFILWLVFLFYFIVRCCQQQIKPKQHPPLCPQVFTGILISIGIALVGFGFYENENAHQGVQDVKSTKDDVINTVTTASHRIDTLSELAVNVSKRLSNALEYAVQNISDPAVRDKAVKLISGIRQEARDVSGYLNKVKVEDLIGSNDDIFLVEYFRWMISVVIFSLYIFIFLLSLIGLLVKSRGTLIVSAAIAVICSLFIWLATGVYLGTSVALGDLCTDPDTYVISLAKGSKVEVAVEAYIKCTDISQPYQEVIISAQTAISRAVTDLNETVTLAKPYNITGMDKFVVEMNNDLQFATGNLSTLLTNVGMCTVLHHLYVKMVDSVCMDSSSAIALLALICCVLGVICTAIIFTMSCVWRQYTKKRHRSEYISADDTDPFLPHPPPYETDYGTIGQSPPRPWSERGSLQPGSAAASDDQVMNLMYQHPLPLDDSPPPAYHSGRFMRQYMETSPTPSAMRSQPAK